MADVRLTATNPEDSSVVPVACDASGRLLLEEQGVGPQGPPGPEGPPGPKGDDGDPFSGNFAGDVTFDGSATFAGFVDSGNLDKASTTTKGVKLSYGGAVNVQREAGNNGVIFEGLQGTSANVVINSDGSAEFAGNVASTGYISGGSNTFTYGIIGESGSAVGDSAAVLGRQYDDNGACWRGLNAAANNTSIISADGSATFAGGKAGFTAEGYLWCTTRRGDTVILDATSNGLANWMDYTPTSRIDEIRDKLDAKRPDAGEMPADTP